MVASIIAIAMLLFGATIVFSELKDALNTIWKVPPKPTHGLLLGMIRDRSLSFAMVVGMGFFLLLSLLLSGVLIALGQILGDRLPGHVDVLRIGNLLFLFSVMTLLCAVIYKILPDISIAWGDVLIGALLTSLLFMVGKFLIGAYLGMSRIASAYGAAGSLVIVLVWVYYSAQILYFGAEFTKVYAHRFGSRRAADDRPYPKLLRPSGNGIGVAFTQDEE
jgi:membrane protein